MSDRSLSPWSCFEQEIEEREAITEEALLNLSADLKDGLIALFEPAEDMMARHLGKKTLGITLVAQLHDGEVFEVASYHPRRGTPREAPARD